MKTTIFGGAILFQTLFTSATFVETPKIKSNNDVIIVEAEKFVKQENTELRKWEVINSASTIDKNHASSASGQAYIKLLPDTRVIHSDKLINGENFSDKPGAVAVISYKVKIKTPGRYYVFARAYSTGSEDNGIHLGIDGTWPESGKRLQWCAGKNTWKWEGKQRTQEQHCGEAYKIYLDIDKAGEHTIQFSMREDGFEMDQFALSMDKDQKFE